MRGPLRLACILLDRDEMAKHESKPGEAPQKRAILEAVLDPAAGAFHAIAACARPAARAGVCVNADK